jgi:hypothetical protein
MTWVQKEPLFFSPQFFQSFRQRPQVNPKLNLLTRMYPDGFGRLGSDFVHFRKERFAGKFDETFVRFPVVAAALDFGVCVVENAVWKRSLY